MSTELKKASDIAVRQCMGIKNSETVLVICDEPCRRIGYSLWESAKEYSAEAILCEIEPRKSNGEEPLEPITGLLESVDAALIPTSRSLSHTEARRNASKHGVRIATLPGITEDTMIRTLNADYEKIGELSRKIAGKLTPAKVVNIKSELGTDIDFYIDGRRSMADTGLNHQPGDFSNLPAGEAYIAPVENMAKGKIVYDGSVAGIGILNKEVIEIDVVDGFATGFNGGKSSGILYSLIEPYGKNAFNIAELGIGTNDMAEIRGSVLEDEKVLGTVHIALGDNKSMGGTIGVPSHIDGVITQPTVTVDGEVIMGKGVLRIS